MKRMSLDVDQVVADAPKPRKPGKKFTGPRLLDLIWGAHRPAATNFVRGRDVAGTGRSLPPTNARARHSVPGSVRRLPSVLVQCDGAAGWLRCSKGIEAKGLCSWAFVALNARTGEVIHEAYGTIENATVPMAEYQAIIEGLTWGVRNASSVTVASDAQLVVRQISGRYETHTPHLVPLRDKARAIAARARVKVRYVWIPREQNTRADALTQRALGRRRTA